MPDIINSPRYGELILLNERNRGGQGTIWGTDNPDILLKRFEPSFIADDPREQRVLRCKAEKAYTAFCAVNKGTQVELQSLPREYLIVRGNPSYLMQKADGELLQTLMRQKKIPPDQKVPLAYALARAMQKLHGAQLVHADINPENFIVRNDFTGWTVFVLDIDGGGLLGPPGPIYPMSQPKRLYKAPELCAMQWEQLQKANLFFAPDAWALSVLLYQILIDYEGPFCSVRNHPNSSVRNYQPYKQYAYRDRSVKWPQPWQEALLKDAPLPHQVINLFYETFQYRFIVDKKEKQRSRPTAKDWEVALSPPPLSPPCHVAVLHTACASAKSAQSPRPVPVSVVSVASGANAVSGSCLPLPARQAAPLCRGVSLPVPVTKKRARLWSAKGLLSWCRSFLGAGSKRFWPSVTTLL